MIYIENSLEILCVEIFGVLDGVFLSLVDGILGIFFGGGVWVFEINV